MFNPNNLLNVKKKNCVICGREFFMNTTPHKAPRTCILRKLGSQTCSKLCSKKYIKETQRKNAREKYTKTAKRN